MPQDVFELPAPKGNTIVGHLLDLSNDRLGFRYGAFVVEYTDRPELGIQVKLKQISQVESLTA